MVLAVQVAGLAFLVIMSYLTFYQYRRDSYSLNSFLAWQAVWLAAAILLFTPRLLEGLVERLHIARITDFYIFLAIAFFGFVTFLTYIKAQRQEKKIEELVRKSAKSR